MFRRLFILFFAFTFISQTNGQEKEAIKVMSYNIRFANPNDGADYWEHRKEDMVQFLACETPDFIGIQEALWSQLEYLDSNLVTYDFYGLGRDDGKQGGETMAILYKKDVWQILDPYTVWLSEEPNNISKGWDAACNRTATIGLFVNETKDTICIINTHFDHVGKEARKNSVQQINQLYSSYKDLYPTIVTGDFNLEPEGSLYEGFIMDDCYEAAETKEEKHIGTYNGFKINGSFDRRIDYIFTDTSRMNVLKYMAPDPKTEEGRQMSDHFPVIVKLALK